MKKSLRVGIATLAVAGTLGASGSALANATTPNTPSATSSSSTMSGPGAHDTTVAGAAKAKVLAAAKAKHAGLTVTQVRMNPDGTYDVIGTANGSPVFYNVSANHANWDADAMAAGHHRGQQQAPSSSSASTGTATTAS